MTRPSCLALLPLLLCACQAPAPERLCRRFVRALAADDAAGVFEGLQKSTQWSLHTVAKTQLKQRALIESAYPAAERAAALSRLKTPPGGDGRALFAALYPDRYRAALQKRLGPVTDREARSAAVIDREARSAAVTDLAALVAGTTFVRPAPGIPAPDGACVAPGGASFRFAPGEAGHFGLADLDAEWEQAKVQAIHDLDTVQDNARLYQAVR